MTDVVIALSMKLWWHVRTSDSLWAAFIRNTYSYKKHLSICDRKVRSSPIWQRLMKVKHNTETSLHEVDNWEM